MRPRPVGHKITRLFQFTLEEANATLDYFAWLSCLMLRLAIVAPTAHRRNRQSHIES